MPPKAPPKPQVFKTPDGKEFSSRTEWRDYMMLTFYSFKNKVNEPEPLVKPPGSIDGQGFDIADCENCTLVVMDNSEQVQIDNCKNCRVFIGACTSSLFIRDCTNCTFYTVCRQLRLRDVTHSTFYIFSLAEVHIEFSNNLKFAPFNGGYPEHAQHLKNANLNVSNTNLWYDIFDHNDPSKTGEHWALLPESEYEAPWFPQGAPCELAIQRTRPGTVVRVEETGMQSFGANQLVADANAADTSNEAPKSPPKSPARSPAKPDAAPTPSTSSPSKLSVSVGSPAATASGGGAAPVADQVFDAAIAELISKYTEYHIGDDAESLFTADFQCVLDNGSCVSCEDMTAVVDPCKLSAINFVSATNSDVAWADFTMSLSHVDHVNIRCTAVLVKTTNGWRLARVHRSKVF